MSLSCSNRYPASPCAQRQCYPKGVVLTDLRHFLILNKTSLSILSWIVYGTVMIR
jgi:hypothetical protein